MLRARLLPLALVGSLALVACVHEPTVTLNHAELNGVQVAVFPPRVGVMLTVVVNITNTNSFDLAVRGMRGQAVLANQYAVPVDFHPPPGGVWLRAGQVTPLRIPVDVSLELALAILRSSLASPIIPYSLIGSVDVTGTSSLKIDKDGYPVDVHGTVTRQQIQGVVPAVFLPR